MNVEVFDNFLNKEDFSDLNKISYDRVGNKEIKIYHNVISKEKILKTENINHDLLLRLNQNYHNFALNLLKKLLSVF